MNALEVPSNWAPALLAACCLFGAVPGCVGPESPAGPAKRARPHVQQVMAGEVTQDSAVLQGRLTAVDGLVFGDAPGFPGVARFEVATNPRFAEPFETDRLKAVPSSDYVVKTKVTGLRPGTRYYYRLLYGPDAGSARAGGTCTFRTLGRRDALGEVSFVVVTGMNYGKFRYGRLGRPVRVLKSEKLGEWYVHSGEWCVEADGGIHGFSPGANAYLVRSAHHPDDFRIEAAALVIGGEEVTLWFAGSPARTERDGYSLAVSSSGAKLQRRGKDVVRTEEAKIEAGREHTLAVEREGATLRARLDGAERPFIEWTDPQPLRGEKHRTAGLYVYGGDMWVSRFAVEPPDAPSSVDPTLFYRGAYRGPDRSLGFPAAEAILRMRPDFFVGTGDNVYYDSPRSAAARTQKELRKKWHEQFAQLRLARLFSQVPSYWEKDDHDFRYDDCDLTGDREPSVELGLRTFLEQLPVADPADEHPLTYRTHRVNGLLQIWLVEGRDYRSPNETPDGPEKTIWGGEQTRWLKRTLLESDTSFKMLISPTPLVGPDRATKRDNHANPRGFRHEGEEFFRWLKEMGFLEKGFYVVCGDRHWQYHAVHPTGFEEFSCGAMVDANAIRGMLAGDPRSTDPQGTVVQRYIQTERSGGFLKVTVGPGRAGGPPTAEFAFYDENGVLLYTHVKAAHAAAR